MNISYKKTEYVEIGKLNEFQGELKKLSGILVKMRSDKMGLNGAN